MRNHYYQNSINPKLVLKKAKLESVYANKYDLQIICESIIYLKSGQKRRKKTLITIKFKFLKLLWFQIKNQTNDRISIK